MGKQPVIELSDDDDDDGISYDPEVMVVHRFDELLDKIQALVDGNAERVRADIERSQAQLEILATLQRLIRNNVTDKPASLEPIKTVLAEMQQRAEAPRPAYEFTIDRDSRGFMSKITARPQGPTTH